MAVVIFCLSWRVLELTWEDTKYCLRKAGLEVDGTKKAGIYKYKSQLYSSWPFIKNNEQSCNCSESGDWKSVVVSKELSVSVLI